MSRLNKIQGETRRFSGALAFDYALVPEAMPFFFELQTFLAQEIACRFSRVEAVDVGVGTGYTTRAVLAAVRECKIIAIDHEPVMLEQATRNLSQAIKAGAVRLVEADALRHMSEIQSGSLDVVFSCFTLHNCNADYRGQLLKSIFETLKSGGMFINSDKYASDDIAEYAREIMLQIIRFDALSKIGREDLRELWIEHEIADQVPGKIMGTKAAIQDLRDIGFSNVDIKKRVGQYAVLTAFKP